MGKRGQNGHHRFAVGAVGEYRETVVVDGITYVLDPEVVELIERMGRLGICP